MKCIQEVSVPYCKSKRTQNEKLNTIKKYRKSGNDPHFSFIARGSHTFHSGHVLIGTVITSNNKD